MRSKEKSTRRALTDVQENILPAQGFVAETDYREFLGNREKIYAVIRCLEIISEASRRIPQDIRERYPHISWRDIAAAGNVYRHEYEAIENAEIWNTVQIDLPPLLAAIAQELDLLSENGA